MSASEDGHVHPRCLRKSMQGACKMLVVLTSHPPPQPIPAPACPHTHISENKCIPWTIARPAR